MTTPAQTYRPCFSGYTAPRSGKQFRCMRARGHVGAHTCAGITWNDVGKTLARSAFNRQR